MKICVTAQGNTLDASVDPRFGRCQYFIYIDSETDAFKTEENPHKDGGGAGIQVGQLMAGEQVDVVLTGNVGPNAFQTLNAANIQVITGITGTVQEAYEQYKKGETKPTADGPSVESHFGMN